MATWPSITQFNLLSGRVTNIENGTVAPTGVIPEVPVYLDPTNAISYSGVEELYVGLPNRAFKLIGFSLRGNWSPADFALVDVRMFYSDSESMSETVSGNLLRTQPSTLIGFTDIILPFPFVYDSGRIHILFSAPKTIIAGDTPSRGEYAAATGRLLGPANGSGKIAQIAMLEYGKNDIAPIVPAPSMNGLNRVWRMEIVMDPASATPPYLRVFKLWDQDQLIDEYVISLTKTTPGGVG